MKNIILQILRKSKSAKNLFKNQTRSNQDLILNSITINKRISNWLSNAYYEKVSFGQNCNSAWYLKETKNKKASYPFDWVFSSHEIICHAIKDEFKSFLKKDLIFQLNDGQAGHSLYHSSLFNHKNPLKSSKEFNYYKRAIERFLTLLKNRNNHILFVCTVIQEPEKRPGWTNGFDRSFKIPKNQTLNSFKETIEFIQNINSNVKFIFINQFTECALNLEIKEMDANFLWIDFYAQGRNNGVKYLDKLDDTIIKNIYSGMNQEPQYNNAEK